MEFVMDIQSTVDTLRSNPKGVRFAELVNICDYFFGPTRQKEQAMLSTRPRGRAHQE